MHVPSWLVDSETAAPCPCGEPPKEDVVIFRGIDGLRRWFHEPCMSFLRYEMTDEQFEELEEWRRHQHEEEGP